MKKTRIGFYLLFISYILLLIEGVQSAFDGCVVGFLGNQTPIYGVDAFHWIVIVSMIVVYIGCTLLGYKLSFLAV